MTAVFQNVLGRAPQPAGLTYWVNAISSGQLSQGDAALAIMAGALANTTAQGLLDGDLIENRLAVAGDFSTQVADQGGVSAYAGATAAAIARNMLGAVTATTDTSAYETIANAAVAALLIAHSPTLELLAGNIDGVNVDGVGAAARFAFPQGVATDNAGNIYVADTFNNIIRKISLAGVVTTLAGTRGVNGRADGTGAAARFWGPSGLAVDGMGNVYVADTYNNTIRKITPTGVVTTLAGTAGVWGSANGSGVAASFWVPSSVAVDSAGNVYVAEVGNCDIRKITPAGVVTTLAVTAASFLGPGGVAVDSAGNVYVADSQNNVIRRVTPAGVATTLAGTAGVTGSANGTGAAASFDNPQGIATDTAGNVYVADTYNNTVRKITPTGVVTTLAGTAAVQGYADGTATAASFNYPYGVATDSKGNVYVADTYNSTIRMITSAGVVSTLAGTAEVQGSVDGIATAANFNQPAGIANDGAGNFYVADTYNNTIRKITPAGVVTTLAGTAGVKGSADGAGSAASFNAPQSLASDSAGNAYVVDTGNNAIRKITPSGMVTTLLSTGIFTYGAITTDSTGNVYVTTVFNYTILKITPAGTVTKLDISSNLVVYSQNGIATDSAGNIYVTDYQANTIYKVFPDGWASILAGKPYVSGSADGAGTAASFNSPIGIAVDNAGNVYVADSGNNAIRKITPAGIVSTVVGTPGQAAGFVAGALPGGLFWPRDIAISGTSLYITTGNGVAVVNNLP